MPRSYRLISPHALSPIVLSFLIATNIAHGQTWIDSLPAQTKRAILWSADHEEGTLADWTFPHFRYAGGGVFNTGGSDVSAAASVDVAHSGKWAARAHIRHARRAQQGPRAVRLMRWTNRAWDDGGVAFPAEAYFSTWLYVPHKYNPQKYPPWDPGDGGWWNIFQFKSKDTNDDSQPVWVIGLAYSDKFNFMYLYLYSKYNPPHSFEQPAAFEVPSQRWVHVEAFYKCAPGKKGRIAVWQDGRKIIDLTNVVTSLGGKTGNDLTPIWGIGSYTDHIRGDPDGEGTATLFFDDAIVSTRRVFPSPP